jgi:ketosteroid isomerase-like protein
MASNEEVVRDGYAAFTSGDMDTLKTMFTSDFVHHVAGSSQLAGDHKGPDGAIALYGRLFELSGGTLKVELEGLKSDGDKVEATHRATAAREGKSLDQPEVMTFTVKDGKMARLDEQPSNQAAFDEFWG